MDRKQQGTDQLFAQIYQQFESDESAQELQFLTAAFDFLNRRSSFLAKPGASAQVMQMVHNHLEAAKKQELENQSLNQKKPEKRTSGITAATKKSISAEEAKAMDSAQADTKAAEPAVSATPMDVDKDKDKEKETKKTVDKVEEEEEDEAGQAPPGNGGTTDKYVWTQSLEEVEVTVEIDANLRAKQLNIRIQKNRLFVAIKGKESTPIIDGALKDAVNVEESTWSLDKEHGKSTKTLTINVVKIKGMTWWDCVIVGDPKIETTKIQPENSKLDTLDDETRQTVEKMMWDQRQKAQGLPTSKEKEQQNILEKFKAQHPEMDFSQLKTAPDGLNQYAQNMG